MTLKELQEQQQKDYEKAYFKEVNRLHTLYVDSLKSYRDLAALTGLSKSTIQFALTGKGRKFNPDTLQMIEQALRGEMND